MERSLTDAPDQLTRAKKAGRSRASQKGSPKMKGLPSPRVGPKSGEVPTLDLDPFATDFLEDPYSRHDELRDAGPVVWLSTYGIYASARYAEVSWALKDHETFCSGRGVGLSDFALETPWRPPSLLLESDPPMHDRMRQIMNRILTPGALKQLRQTWLEKAVELAETLLVRKSFDMITELAEVFPMMIFPDTLGLKEDGREHLLPYAAAVFNGFGPRNKLYQETTRCSGDAAAWVLEACRRDTLRPDGWGMAVFKAADAGLCSEEEAGRLVRSLISAGVDTTINGIGNMMAAFVAHPAQWDLLRSDPTLRKKAFEESLRWNSTVQTFFRTTTCETTLGGAPLPEGAKILLFLASANRDPRHWDRPERFDITRQTSGHVGFGYGIHQCLGQMVARMEAEVMLEALGPRFKSIRQTNEKVGRLNNTLHALASLPVEIEPARPVTH